MFTSRDRYRMNIDDGPQSARQKKSRGAHAAQWHCATTHRVVVDVSEL